MVNNIQDFLKTNKSFCMYLWSGIYIDPYGDVYPCCVGSRDGTFGNVKEHSLLEIWNSEKYKQTRLQMLEGKEFPKACAECEIMERYGMTASVREHANNLLKDYFPVVQETKEDGSLENFKLRYLDIRFSNLCNFKCRYCHESLSSSWAQENRKLHPENATPVIIHASDHNKNLIEQIIPHLEFVNTIYFAGGEPLITPEHYEILEHIVNNNLTNIKLRYNSNCSKLNQKDYNIADIWNKFDEVVLQASLDSYADRAKFMRHGTEWDTVMENLRTIRRKAPNVKLEINCVVSCFNVLTITEFLEDLVKQNIISDEHPCPYINFYPLHTPSYFAVSILPKSLVQSSIEKIDTFIQNCNPQLFGINIAGLQNLRDKFLSSIEYEHKHQAKMFKKEIIIRDELRNENFCETFPELAEWYNSI